MVFGVCVPTDVAHPHVKPNVGQEVAKALIGQVGQPVGTGTEEAVLEEENWAWSLSGCG